MGRVSSVSSVSSLARNSASGRPASSTRPIEVQHAGRRLHEHAGKYALCTMCIGVGQGIAVILERV